MCDDEGKKALAQVSTRKRTIVTNSIVITGVPGYAAWVKKVHEVIRAATKENFGPLSKLLKDSDKLVDAIKKSQLKPEVKQKALAELAVLRKRLYDVRKNLDRQSRP